MHAHVYVCMYMLLYASTTLVMQDWPQGKRDLTSTIRNFIGDLRIIKNNNPRKLLT